MRRLLLLVLLLPMVHADFIKYDYVPILGIDSSTGQGIAGYLELTLRDGSGLVTYSGNIDPSFMEEDSGILHQVMDQAGEDFFSFDYHINYGFPALKVSGRSASASLYILAYSIVYDRQLSKNTIITGVFDGGKFSSGSGVEQKLDAAAFWGMDVVLPSDSEIFRYQTVGSGGAVLVERVDLEERARNLGISVHEVSSIEEAYQYLFK